MEPAIELIDINIEAPLCASIEGLTDGGDVDWS